jgi:hypothetical protein
MKELPLSKVYQLLEPGPVVLLTTARKERTNVMTMSWHMMIEFEPPQVACVVSSANYSFAAPRTTGECVIGIPARKLDQSSEDRKYIGPQHRQIRDVLSDGNAGRARGAAAHCRLLCQSRMQGDRHALCEQVQPFRSRSAQGLDRSSAEESENHSPPRIWHVRSRRRDDHVEVADAMIHASDRSFPKHGLTAIAFARRFALSECRLWIIIDVSSTLLASPVCPQVRRNCGVMANSKGAISRSGRPTRLASSGRTCSPGDTASPSAFAVKLQCPNEAAIDGCAAQPSLSARMGVNRRSQSA